MSLAQATLSGSPTNPTVSYGNDSSLFVEFSKMPMKDEEASNKEGREIFHDVNMITIHIPGGQNKVVRPVNMHPHGGQPSDPDRFPQQWQRFKNQETQSHDGTPLEEWAPIGKAMALNLKAINVHTVEQLAAMPDSNLSFMGGQDYKQKAIAWLQNAQNGAEAIRMQAKIDELEKQLAGLMNQNEGFKAEKRGPGRPPKDE